MYNFFVFMIILSLSATAFSEPPEGYPFQNFDKAMKQAQSESKLLFVYFGRYGCGYCDKTNKEAFSDPEVKMQFINNYVLAYVDSESGKRLRLPTGERITERELGRRYKAAVTPVFSFMKPSGEVVSRLVGVQSKNAFLEQDNKIQTILNKAHAQ